MAKLTTDYVRKIEASAKDLFVWDERLPGFGLRVKPSGTKSFVIQYRNRQGQSKRRTIGQWSKPLTADEAFRAAREELANVTLGADPVEEIRAKRAAGTISELCAEYLRDAEAGRLITRRGTTKARSTIATDRGRIETHIVPLIGTKPVAEISRKDVIRLRDDISDGKTARNIKTGTLRGRSIVRGGSGTAKRTIGLLQGILAYAVDRGLIEANPAHGVPLPHDKRRRVSNIDETYAALGKALRLSEAAGEHWQAVAIVRLIALTGLRRGEAVELEWRSVDRARQVIDLETSKTGESIRPVGQPVIDLLTGVGERHNDRRKVFPGVRQSEGSYAALPRAWARIVTAKGLTERERELLADMTPHKLRHAFASKANALGLTTPTVSALLGHKSRGVTEGYISHVDNVLLGASNKVTGAIQALMGADQTAEVIRFPAG